MRELPHALAPMSAYKQFIIYKMQPSATKPGKLDKFPCDFRTGAVVNAHSHQVWTDPHTAIAAAATFGASYGVGFVFTEADPFWFIDLDHCRMPDDTWSPVAQQLCQVFAGCAIEVSVSGTGLHIFGTGQPPAHGCESPHDIGGFYHTGRFVALTGHGIVGNAATDGSRFLPWLVDSYFPPKVVTHNDGWTEAPCEEWRGPIDDAELLRRAMRSQSAAAAFGGRATFADLWTANAAVLAVSYPDAAKSYNASEADAALAQHLAFWTGRDCARMERLMRQSALVRDKWEQRDDYLVRTILGAVGRQLEVLTDRAPEPPPVPAAPITPTGAAEPAVPQAVAGSTFVNPTDQVGLFAGCVYIADMHRVLIPGGRMLKPEQFRVHFGGYQLPLDHANEKVTRDAWEAFTQSLAWRCPKAERPAFRPDLPPGAIITKGGQSFVNTYWPVDVPRKVGDATPFFTHLAKLLPNERDRHIVLSYMAACVQHAGFKFQWAPLIQGCEGNGKTLLSRCVAEAVGRRYVHWPKASQLTAQFNGWLVGKVFYAVEDIYVHSDRAEMLEILKPMITGDDLEIEMKGVDQISAEVCGNFMFNSNHKTALPKGRNDRRISPFYTAQQDARDLVRDGMTGDYFPKLYDWLRAEGYAIVAELLHTMPIPDDYNPATGCPRGPDTESTQEAIKITAGTIEQEIQEAIEQGAPGFVGGYISTIMLDRLLEKLRVSHRMPHSKRKEMLEGMGYRHHPLLTDGRVNNNVLPDNGKPKLFVHETSHARALATPSEVARHYESLNNIVAGVPFRSM